MPLLLIRKGAHNSRIAVWRVEESNDYFLQALQLTEAEQEAYAAMKPHRQREWLSSRFLLHRLAGDKQRHAILKDKHGKPYRENCPEYISLSHSRDFVAVILSEKPVGIDIQKKEDKITRIAHKFVNQLEDNRIPDSTAPDYYHAIWGAKESMYKAYGKKNLDFKKHMHVYPFQFLQSITAFRGHVSKEEIKQDYHLELQKIDGAYLVYCVMD